MSLLISASGNFIVFSSRERVLNIFQDIFCFAAFFTIHGEFWHIGGKLIALHEDLTEFRSVFVVSIWSFTFVAAWIIDSETLVTSGKL